MSVPGRFCCRSRRQEERDPQRRIFKDAREPLPCRLLRWERRLGCRDYRGPLYNSDRPDAYPTHAAAIGGGCAASLASLRRFWAIAASVNSSCAPRGPRNRRRPSFRCASSGRTASRHACDRGVIARTPRSCRVRERHREPPRRCCAGSCAPAPSGSTAS